MIKYIEREAVENLITKGLNNPDKEKAYGYDAVEILTDVHYMDAADVIEIDKVAEMFNDFCGDYCACNYNDTDEWLPFCCELIEECPVPKDTLGCWKQFIKHYHKRNINFLE